MSFVGDQRFFTRDTGLLCRGFQATGHDCVVVMPGEKHPDEPDDLVRCSHDKLTDTQWWKSLHVDCVILYAWGDPRHLPVAKAIRGAGIKLVQSLDTVGMFSPYADFGSWLGITREEIMIPDPLPRRIRRVARIFRDLMPCLYDIRRVGMLSECELLATVSPSAMDSVASYVRSLSGLDISGKLRIIPHPVSMKMVYRGEEKSNRLLVVGRWSDSDKAQKDPLLTLRVIAEFLSNNATWEAYVIGWGAQSLHDTLQGINHSVESRLHFEDFIHHDRLQSLYATSRIHLCASRYESFHIASAEALCCGCSVVVAGNYLLSPTRWFCQQDSGTAAVSRKVGDLVDALSAEAHAWSVGNRDAAGISKDWCSMLHADRIADSIANLMAGRNTGG